MGEDEKVQLAGMAVIFGVPWVLFFAFIVPGCERSAPPAQAAPPSVAAPIPPPPEDATPVAPHLRGRKYDLGTRTYGSWNVSTTRTDPHGPIIVELDDVRTDQEERIVCVIPGDNPPTSAPSYSCVTVR